MTSSANSSSRIARGGKAIYGAPPYTAALQAEVGLPVYAIYSMITWFHAGLRPRVFA